MTHDQVLWQILSALAVILTVVATRLQQRREHKKGLEATAAKLDAVQETVNGTTGALAARTEQLASTLSEAGLPVPPKPQPAPAPGAGA